MRRPRAEAASRTGCHQRAQAQAWRRRWEPRERRPEPVKPERRVPLEPPSSRRAARRGRRRPWRRRRPPARTCRGRRHRRTRRAGRRRARRATGRRRRSSTRGQGVLGLVATAGAASADAAGMGPADAAAASGVASGGDNGGARHAGVTRRDRGRGAGEVARRARMDSGADTRRGIGAAGGAGRRRARGARPSRAARGTAARHLRGRRGDNVIAERRAHHASASGRSRPSSASTTSCDVAASASRRVAGLGAGPASAWVPVAARAAGSVAAEGVVHDHAEVGDGPGQRRLALLHLGQALEDLVPELGRRQRHRPHEIGIRLIVTRLATLDGHARPNPFDPCCTLAPDRPAGREKRGSTSGTDLES